MNRTRIAITLFAGAGLWTAGSASAQDKVSFEKDVYPFLETKCVECHRAPYEKGGRVRKPKADLRFDAAFGIVKGGESGAVVAPGKPDDSPILQRTMLAEDHDDFMPPKGDPLTDKEKETLKKWIEEGADFGGWKGSEEERPADAKDTFADAGK